MERPTEINALVNLLDDPDYEVYNHIKQKLMDYGPDVIPLLEKAWEDFSYGVVFQNRIEEIIHQIQFEQVQYLLREWVKGSKDNLLDALFIVSQYQYPDINIEKYKSFLELLKRDIWLELNDNLTALEQVKVINRVLFNIHNFSGNTTNYHAPQNSYINDVLDTKKGTPLSLSVLYIVLARMLNIPIYGINLPRHFIIGYVDRLSNEKDKILFYVNPFSRGAVLSKRDIDYFLKQLKLEQKEDYFVPCDNLAIIKRLLNNLIFSYAKLGQEDKVKEMNVLLQILED